MITVRNLYHSYGNDDDYQVKDVSFEIQPGEVFGFLGPNGAGKSTTQKIITGLLPLQRGEVEVLGHDIRTAGRAIFNEIGVAFEQPNLYKKLTGLENLTFFRQLYAGDTEDPLALLRLFGLEEAAGKRVAAYSKGMQQRVVLARSLLNQPKIWFLDEPTAGLDPASAREIRQLVLRKKAEGTAIFLTTHDMHVAEELCDRVAFINDGEIVAMDSPRNLKLKYGEKLLRVEFRENGRVATEQLNQTAPEDISRLSDLLADGTVETIHSQEASLETIFIALTGRELA